MKVDHKPQAIAFYPFFFQLDAFHQAVTYSKDAMNHYVTDSRGKRSTNGRPGTVRPPLTLTEGYFSTVGVERDLIRDTRRVIKSISDCSFHGNRNVIEYDLIDFLCMCLIQVDSAMCNTNQYMDIASVRRLAPIAFISIRCRRTIAPSAFATTIDKTHPRGPASIRGLEQKKQCLQTLLIHKHFCSSWTEETCPECNDIGYCNLPNTAGNKRFPCLCQQVVEP